MFSNHLIANFPLNAQVKIFFDTWSIFGKDMDKTLWLTFFLGHLVYLHIEFRRISFKSEKRFVDEQKDTETGIISRIWSVSNSLYGIVVREPE